MPPSRPPSADTAVRIASYVHDGTASFGLVTDDGLIDASPLGYADLRSMLEAVADGPEAGSASGLADALDSISGSPPAIGLDAVTLLPPVPNPSKIICIGINYGNRDAEYTDGAEGRTYPGVFPRMPESFVGHDQPILRPPESEQLDYEGEIVVVLGAGGRRIPEAEAEGHIAGLSIMNEGTIRDWTRHSRFNVTQGKNFGSSGSIGPWMVTADTFDGYDDLDLTTRVNGEVRQQDSTANLLMPFRSLIAYLSVFFTLHPGDMIATGTPTGAGARFDPPRWLVPGDVVEVDVGGVGVLRNMVEDEAV